ncbi:hypothetical protein SprV_0200932300 [Sparganum proliferum]
MCYSKWEKNALRICGNWSEQLSSKGKVYFYNCITEISQWQKPSEWTLPDVSKKELLKMIGDRTGLDDRNRQKQHDSSSPKRPKCCVDTTKDTPERLKSDADSGLRNTSQSHNRDGFRKADSTGIDSTKDHFRQLADDIRESWGNILASASIPSVATCVGIQKPFTTSRPNEDTNCRLPTTCSVSKLSTDMSRLRENTTDSQGYNSCGLLRTPSSREQTEASLASRITAMANLLTSAASQGFKRSPRTLTNQSFPNNSNFRSAASSRGCNTDSTLANSPVPNGPSSFGAGNISQGDARTQTSDVLRPTSSSNRGVEVLPTVSSNSRLSSGLSATPMPSADSSTVGSSNDVANANLDWRHSSSQYGEKPSLLGHYNSGTTPRPNIVPGQALRNIVTLLNNAVNARRDLHSGSTPGSHRTPVTNPSPSANPIKEVVNTLSILHSYKKQSDGRQFTETASPCNRGIANGSVSFRPDVDRHKSAEGFLGPPSSDGTSIINSPSYTRTSPHLPSPTTITSTCLDSHSLRTVSAQVSSDDACKASRLPTVNPSPQLSSTSSHDLATVSAPETADVEQQKLEASLLILENPELQKYSDPSLTEKFQLPLADSLENEAQLEFRKFDRLHSVLYSELSGELKKLRALVGISETKLKINQKRKEALEELMDALEVRKTLPSIITSDPPV